MKNYSENISAVLRQYGQIKATQIHGRYITQKDIAPLLEKLSEQIGIHELGKSALGKPIHIIELGKGKTKVLAWSQMHGNESTTTKAVFDLLNAFTTLKNNKTLGDILENCSIRIIPMLNPDGAQAYTRVNANEVDLNRDAHVLKEVESRLLRKAFDDFEPDFCLNLHDQRTIFSAGRVKAPATLSFLTPSSDAKRSVTKFRKKSMQVIAGIAEDLKQALPGQIGRYDDGFNINCTGDTFQSKAVPTILFEAGHYPDDYEREQTRKFVFAALVSALRSIASAEYELLDHEKYFEIPENEKLFNDIVLRNAQNGGGSVDISIQFKEELEESGVQFVPMVEKISGKIENFGHREIDCEEKKVSQLNGKKLAENVVVDKILLNGLILELKCE
ncbi:MAG: M14 family zinc carboxypeptidase [Salegentibacter sp.]